MRTHYRLILLILSISLGLCSNLQAIEAKPDPAAGPSIDALIAKHIVENGAGVAILAARDGKIIFEKGYGLADVENHVPVTPGTKFRIGSITKQFTAAAILRLQEAGKLRTTDLLSKYYPEFPRGNEVTLRHLLTHTSGIHSYTEVPGFMAGVTKPTTNVELIASIEKLPFDFDPGAKWSYSNSNFILLGEIVRKVSGLSYDEYLRRTFFEPLGMDSTGVYHNDAPPAGAAIGYEYKNGSYTRAIDWDMSWAGGAGAIYSTVEDLYRWNEGIFGQKVLGKESLSEAFTPVVTPENKGDKGDEGYGYGWMIDRFRGARRISHSGGLHGFLSNILRLPDKNMTVVVLVNAMPQKSGLMPEELARATVTLCIGAELDPLPQPLAAPLSEEALAAIVGRYDLSGMILTITAEGGRAFEQLGPQKKFEIFPKSDTDFFLKVVDAQVTFTKGSSGKAVEAILHQNGMTLHAPRMQDVVEIKLDEAHSNPILGVYDAKPIGTMTISRDSGRLYTQLTGQPKLEMGAKSDTEFFLKQVNAQLTFIKDANGVVTGVILHQHGRDQKWPKSI
jgi:CubicO group peptidase (beta-lactamase class C family)